MLSDTFEILCPHCGEPLELLIEADVLGELIQDCEICCRPIKLFITRDGWHDPHVRVEPAE